MGIFFLISQVNEDKMKRIALFIFLSLIIVSSIFSISLDEIISGAKELKKKKKIVLKCV